MADVTPGAVPFEEAIGFLKQKVNLPTRAWTDLQEGAHARSFMVAGAMKEQLLSDFHGALVKALKDGTTKEQFQKAFDDIAARHGWDFKGARRWRARVIYDTNLRMARAAGRWDQIQRTKASRPWLRYVAVLDSRTRPEHKAWHGVVRPVDDAFFQSHYPPNGWMCRCTVEQLSDRDLKRYGYAPTPDDQVPPIEMEDRVVKTPDGEEIWPTPKGIDTGFGHNVGRSWLSGTAPRQLQEPLRPFGAPAPAPKSLPPLPARPSKAKLLPDDLPDEEYIRRFLKAFGGTPGKPVTFRDAAGHAVAVGEEVFRAWPGGPLLKLAKRDRHRYLLLVAEALLDPDEIWLDWADVKGKPFLRRRYLRRADVDGAEGALAVLEWSSAGWHGRTVLQADANYIDNQRRGALLWRRGGKS